MMARYRRSLRPVNRIKHVVDSQATVAANVNHPITIAGATDTPVLGSVTGVETGSTINGIFLVVNAVSNEPTVASATPNFYFMISKNPGGNVTMPAPNAVGVSDNKRFVFHQEMTMIENNGVSSNSKTIFKGVIVIPKAYRRMAPNDTITINMICPAIDTAICIQAHYKEFR